MGADGLRRHWPGALKVVWALLFLSLPVTSFPPLARASGASTVAPLAALPAAVLIVAWLTPHLLRRGTLPRLALPLVAFGGAALISAAGALLIEVPPYKGNSVAGQMISALITLGLGGAFYALAAGWPRDDERLRFTLQLINTSGLVLLLWALVQALVIVLLDERFPAWMVAFQDWISLRGVFAVQVSGFPRLTGFAYEPSWLAHQLNLVYLPFWLGATVNRHSVHRRLGMVSVENLLLGGGFLALLLSFSRVGILAFLLVILTLIVRANLRWIRALSDRLLGRPAAGLLQAAQGLLTALMVGISVLGYLALTLGVVYAMGRFDRRLAALFDPNTYAQGNFYAVTNQLAFAERVVYWGTGWEIFNDHPALGVGPGNAGFFFVEEMPAFGWSLYESGRIFFRRAFLPNTKSMWVRILSETGLLGFAAFATWYYLTWQAARLLEHARDPVLRTCALAGGFALIAFLVEGFSIDSYALPYLWISLGLVAAAVSVWQGQATDGARN